MTNTQSQLKKKTVSNDDLKQGGDSGQESSGGASQGSGGQAPAEGLKSKPQGSPQKPGTGKDSSKTQNQGISKPIAPQDSVKREAPDKVMPKQNGKPDSIPVQNPSGVQPNKQEGTVPEKRAN